MNIYKMPLEQFQVNTKFWRNLRVNSFTMKMEIVLEPISNKLMRTHDVSQTTLASDTLIDISINISIQVVDPHLFKGNLNDGGEDSGGDSDSDSGRIWCLTVNDGRRL
ncbi:hypothetical protein Tco_0104069 [Tanacetum coccineum]